MRHLNLWTKTVLGGILLTSWMSWASPAPKGAPSSAWLLSHSEFLSLTGREKKLYLKKVKKILSTLSGQSRYFAIAPTATSRLPASETPVTSDYVAKMLDLANQNLGPKPALWEYSSEKERFPEFRQRWEDSLWMLVTARMTYQDIPDSDPDKKALGERITEAEDYFLTIKGRNETLPFDPENKLNLAFERMEAARAGSLSWKTPNAIPKGTLVKRETKETRTVINPAPPKKPETPAPVTDLSGPAPTAEPRGYRCMYAGFVLKKDPCKGPQTFPEGFELKGLSKQQMTCESNQILCNPLLFGVQTDCSFNADFPADKIKACLEDASPLCVPRGKDATLDCTNMSSANGYLASAAALIQENPEAWNDYLQSFYELCDDEKIKMNDFAEIGRDVPESTRSDIRRTCTNAKKQLAALTEEFRVESTRPMKKGPVPTGTTEKSSTTPPVKTQK